MNVNGRKGFDYDDGSIEGFTGDNGSHMKCLISKHTMKGLVDKRNKYFGRQYVNRSMKGFVDENGMKGLAERKWYYYDRFL